jgi:hypothetical protein
MSQQFQSHRAPLVEAVRDVAYLFSTHAIAFDHLFTRAVQAAIPGNFRSCDEMRAEGGDRGREKILDFAKRTNAGGDSTA